MHRVSRATVVALVLVLNASLVALAQDHPASSRISSVPRSQGEECFLLGNEFAVASFGRWISNFPIHFHSNDGLDFPAETADFAEVGECCSGDDFEEVRGLGEFDMTGMETVDSASLFFEVIVLGGLYMQFPPAFEVQAVAYPGNNTEELGDYTAAAAFSLGTFATSGLGVGDWVELDITDAFNDAVGSPSLGVRLQANSEPGGGAIVFGNFEICPGEQVVPTAPVVALWALALLLVLAGYLVLARRERRI